MNVGAGIGHDGAVGQGGANAALQLAGLFVHEGGRAADEALAALGQVGTQYEVQLAACTADVLHTGALGRTGPGPPRC